MLVNTVSPSCRNLGVNTVDLKRDQVLENTVLQNKRLLFVCSLSQKMETSICANDQNSVFVSMIRTVFFFAFFVVMKH